MAAGSTASAPAAADAPRKRPSRTVLGPRRDHVAVFRPAVVGVRAGAVAISLALASPAIADADWTIIAWCVAVVLYNVFRIVQPLRYHNDTSSVVRLLVEVSFHVVAVVATGSWDSPLVFALVTAVMVAGFARGFAFALRIGAISALAVSIPFLADTEATVDDLRTATQWTVQLVLVALIAGYARRISGEADREHTLALDRLGRLADANLLLHSLHRVAQTLPASLDLEDALDTTMGRLRDLSPTTVRRSCCSTRPTRRGWWSGRRVLVPPRPTPPTSCPGPSSKPSSVSGRSPSPSCWSTAPGSPPRWPRGSTRCFPPETPPSACWSSSSVSAAGSACVTRSCWPASPSRRRWPSTTLAGSLACAPSAPTRSGPASPGTSTMASASHWPTSPSSSTGS